MIMLIMKTIITLEIEDYYNKTDVSVNNLHRKVMNSMVSMLKKNIFPFISVYGDHYRGFNNLESLFELPTKFQPEHIVELRKKIIEEYNFFENDPLNYTNLSQWLVQYVKSVGTFEKKKLSQG